ncbi:MAG TPA: gas vesicle protein GvpG [Planctomycetota bacterium]|nr:gas vesicle protein GvpG [Planctomycetota bacterium]
MIFLDRLFTNGVRFVLNAIVTAAEAELGDSEEALRQELLDAQMRLELGEIDEAAFAEIEAQVLPRLRAIRESQLEQVERARREALSSSDVAVEVEIEGFDSDTQRG